MKEKMKDKRDKNYYKKIAKKIAEIANSKKAENIVIYDTENRSSLFYYVVIATVESTPQAEAISEEIQQKLKKEKIYLLYKDGINSKSWKVMDYGGVIVHIIEPETRDFYALDKIYYECKKLDWKEKEIKKQTGRSKK